MIWVNEGRDQEARAILELAGIDSDKYRIWHHNSIYVHAINEDTKEAAGQSPGENISQQQERQNEQRNT